MWAKKKIKIIQKIRCQNLDEFLLTLFDYQRPDNRDDQKYSQIPLPISESIKKQIKIIS